MAITSGFNKDLLAGVSRLHFIGIGGSGMFPLVQILASKGYTITGSDVNEGTIIDAERAMGIQVYMGHAAEHVLSADMVVYSAAIHADNAELQEADIRGIPCVERSVMLGYVSRLYPRSVCVAGTHGKTTTTSLITTMLELAGRDPAAVIGGKLPLIHGYGKAGLGQNIVVEACEFAETFLHLTPDIAVLLNIDNDHLDYYGTIGQNFRDALEDMIVFDAIILNTDRHLGNFGFLVDAKSNTLLGPAPLFDHGNSLCNFAAAADIESREAFLSYANAQYPACYANFLGEARTVLRERHKKALRKLFNFRFRRHPRYNLPQKRLQLLEGQIQERAAFLLSQKDAAPCELKFW